LTPTPRSSAVPLDAPATSEQVLPNLFLVGAPRSGTTMLHTCLAQHPEVFMSGVKEPHYFCKDVNEEFEAYQGGPTDPLFKHVDQYLRLFRESGDRKVRGESSVFYLYSDRALRDIPAFNPEARGIVMLREPLEFLRSMHAKLLWDGDEECRDFERALELEPERRAGRSLPPNVRFPSILFYSRYVAYAERLERCRASFGEERVHVILLEDFRRRPQEVWHGVLDFLDVARIPLPVDTDRNPNLEPRSLFVNRLLRERKRRRFWLRRRVRTALERLNRRESPRRELAPEVAARLRERFAPEVAALEACLGRDVRGLWGVR
jgi:hypothetical protein